MSVKDRILLGLLAAVALALVWAMAEAALTMRAWRELPGEIVVLADDRLADVISRADEQISAARADAAREIARTRWALLGRVDGLASRVDARLGEIQKEVAGVSSRAQEAASTATSLLEDARPGVQAWSSLSPSLAANTLGLLAAAKVTAGESAQTMRHVRLATPEIVQAIQASAIASQQAAQSAAQTSQNLAELTKPGPRWLRWVGLGASVAVPASQVAMPIVIGRIK